MVWVDNTVLTIDLLNTLLVVADIEDPVECLLSKFLDTLGSVTSHGETAVDETAFRVEFGDPVILIIEALVVCGILTTLGVSHVLELTTIEVRVVKLLCTKLLNSK